MFRLCLPRARASARESLILLVGWSLWWPGAVAGETLTVAVASNFAPAFEALAEDFEARTGYRSRVSTASTGKLYAQIRNGAPFDVFLAADAIRPAQLEQAGLTLGGSRYTYAVGRLVLWSRDPDLGCAEWLTASSEGKLAIANPIHAPYGVAAKEVLDALRIWQRYRTRLVTGENVAQALHFTVSGNARAGLLAASQIAEVEPDGCQWNVPRELYRPIEQQVVVLARAAEKSAAIALAEYLRSEEARIRIRRAGYDLAPGP